MTNCSRLSWRKIRGSWIDVQKISSHHVLMPVRVTYLTREMSSSPRTTAD